MIAEVVLRHDPTAALSLVCFIVAGIIACLVWLWWLWWTLWKYPCGHTPQECSCSWSERNGLQ